MKRRIAELDVVEVTADLPQGVVEGAHGTVVSVREGVCTVEFVDPDGYTVGLFEISSDDLEVVGRSGASLAREQ